jgi:hypothetical protein
MFDAPRLHLRAQAVADADRAGAKIRVLLSIAGSSTRAYYATTDLGS